MRFFVIFGVSALAFVGCGDDADQPPAGTGGAAPALCEHVAALDAIVPPEAYDYTWSCTGAVAPAGESLPAAPVPDDCTSGIWPDLDDTIDVCPTVSDVTKTDPVSGKLLPSEDDRALPIDVPVNESGSFLPSGPASWPETLRVVAWNVEYTASLDQQIDALLAHPDLAGADVYLLSEVDRCSERNERRRAARLIAEALEADYVYGVEFVELAPLDGQSGRTVGGDTGQAIISRRPLASAALRCHSSQSDWFASEDQPRLGQRVFLHADVPVGDELARVYAVHLESDDAFGEKRAVQAKELLDQAQARACDRPQIFGGDFNAPYCGAPELEVIRDAGFLDAVAFAGDVDPTHQNGLRLDYLWTRGFQVIAGGVVRDVVASDHSAIWAELARDTGEMPP